MRRIHIAMVGETIENVVRGVTSIGAEELYPITSQAYRDSQEKLAERLPWLKINTQLEEKDICLLVDPFKDTSYEQIIELIIDIVQERRRREPEIKFWINITGGTNLMSAAASAGAILTRSKAYYMLKGKPAPIILPWHSLVPKNLHPIKKAIIAHLMNNDLDGTGLCDGLSVKSLNDGISFNVNGRILTYHLKGLQERGYIERKEKGRNKINSLSPWGKIAYRLLVEE